MSLMTPEAKGREAQRILDNEVFREAFTRAEDTLTKQWRTAPSPQEREALWHKLQALAAIKTALQAMVGDGDFAAHARQQQERRQANG